MLRYVLTVDGMVCGMCEAHICDVIRKTVPGAKKVSAARRRNEATFISDVAVDAGKLMEAINATGYTCSDVKSSPYEKKGLFGLG